MPTKTARKKWQTALAEIEVEARAEFPDEPDRLNQLSAHLSTVSMVLDNLCDYPTPPPAAD